MSRLDDDPLADPYAELGVSPDASEAEIKAAYRRLAARWHPDRNPHAQAAERMKRINQAYQQLSEAGFAPPQPQETRDEDSPDPAADDQAREHNADDPPPRPKRAWWERDWGGARWEPDGRQSPRTLHHDAELSLEAAAFGTLWEVRGRIADLCGECAGTGRLVAPRSACRTCGGDGRVPGATPGRWQRCPDCRGDGAERQACGACRGSGLQEKERPYRYEVRIPAGLRDGQTVKLRRQGQRLGEERGDIELTLRVRPHPLFSFDAQERLHCRVPVDLYRVAAGDPLEVPTLDGRTVLIDPAGGSTQLLENQGFPQRGDDGRRGPMVVELDVITPPARSETQRRLLRELAESLRRDGYAGCPDLADWQQRLDRWREERDIG